MNIKSLLLGSAAALVAVSGARAADAVVVAEPEPAEYVRICDVYGAGYFYIPGTETCLKIGGYVRYDASVGSRYNGYDGVWNMDKRTDKWQGTWAKTAKIVLNVDTGQETEYGTLSTHIGIKALNSTSRVDGDLAYIAGGTPGYSTTTNSAGLDSASIKLGGLTIAYQDSIYADWTGYAGAAVNNSFIEYGDYANTNQISYTFDAGNGFSAIVGLEQGYSDTIDSYVPHVVLGAKFTQGWGGISGVVAYNSVQDEFAGKLRADINVNDQFSLFVMGGIGSDKHRGTTDKDAYSYEYKPWSGAWAIWGGGQYKLNEKATLYAEASYDADKDAAASLGVAYELVPGFVIKPELNYTRWGNHAGPSGSSLIGGDGVTVAPKKSGWGGVIRFQRNF
ncbi:porin [Mesorhizobium sp. CN5-321]|uniref:porin n=1 Tax=Mesorhizobium hunchu TaxID=3157708 RepID=UPI0032B72D09